MIIAAEGSKSDIAKPMKGLGPGVYVIALAYRSDAYRTVYAVKLGEDIWVVHAYALGLTPLLSQVRLCVGTTRTGNRDL